MTAGTAAPPMDLMAMISKIQGGGNPEGWAALDPANPQNAEAKKLAALERYNRARIIATGISDEALDLLRQQTVDIPTWQVHELGLAQAIGFGIMREGQNSLVRWIEQQKRIAAQGPEGDVPAAAPARRKRVT